MVGSERGRAGADKAQACSGPSKEGSFGGQNVACDGSCIIDRRVKPKRSSPLGKESSRTKEAKGGAQHGGGGCAFKSTRCIMTVLNI
jgi:hypothetical protein